MHKRVDKSSRSLGTRFQKNFWTVHPFKSPASQNFCEFLMLQNVTPQMSNWQLLSLSIPIDDPDDYQAQKLFEGKRKPTNCYMRGASIFPTSLLSTFPINFCAISKSKSGFCARKFKYFNYWNFVFSAKIQISDLTRSFKSPFIEQKLDFWSSVFLTGCPNKF